MTTRHSERFWRVGGVLGALAMVLVGYVLFIGPQNSQTAAKSARAGDVRRHNDELQRRIDELSRQNQDIDTYRRTLEQAQSALPNTSGLTAFLRTLQALGNATLADVSTLTVGAPANVTTLAAGGAAAAPAGVYALPISAQVSGTTTQLAQFLTQLQSVQPRAVLISQIAEAAAPGAKSASSGRTLQLTMQAFVAPASQAEGAALSAAAR